MTRICLDAGHGGFNSTPGKRTPDGEFEWSFNNAVLLACAERLGAYQDVEILRLDDPSGKTDVPLRTRADKANAWRADVLVSIHHNASAGAWHAGGGVETYVDNTASKASRDIAAIIHPRIVTAMGLRDRGVKTANFHMTRESRMPAILTEGGFMDSTVDVKAMRDPAKLKAQGYAIADGLAQYFGLKSKAVAYVESREADDMQFTSGTLRKEWETFLGSKAQREIAVKAAVEAGYSAKWITDLESGKIADGDVAALAIGALIRANK